MLAEIDTYKQAHLNWVTNSETMQKSGPVINMFEVPAHTDCSFGRWYYGVAKGKFSHLREFTEIEAPHNKFHENLKEYAEVFKKHGAGRAQAILDQMKSTSLGVINTLDQLKKGI
jgi:methyl-accepting chemotaxis protein